jgi:hypothetical protein
MIFPLLIALVATLAGAIASLAGFGVGSLLTPTLGFRYGIKLAVAAVSIPHLFATALRFWTLRRDVDRRVFLSFGAMSAVGGLTGALLHTVFSSPMLGRVLGVLLVFVGLMELTGLGRRLRFGGAVGWVAGALSGLLGGLVGNQGGIRSAALLGFALPSRTFVATATAIALVIDAARMPVYFITQWRALAAIWPAITIAVLGALLGTIVGRRALEHLPQLWFRRTVAVVLLALGVALLLGVGS